MIRIFPIQHIRDNNLDINKIINDLSDFSVNKSLNDIIGDYVIFNSGKVAIRAIISNLNLKIDDEVYITTTTDSTFVSTCVSATIFNYCKISRVITDKTRAIFVIHTFGFPHPELLKLRKIANELNIPLIEDCISAFNSYNTDNIRLGSIGDYAVYSLPKIIPIKYGGILTSKLNDIQGIKDNYLTNNIKLWTPFLDKLRNNSRKNYFYLKEVLGNPVYQEDQNANPYMYGFFSRNYEIAMKDLLEIIEFGKTHVENEIHIPVNPFIAYDKETRIIKRIYRKIIK